MDDLIEDVGVSESRPSDWSGRVDRADNDWPLPEEMDRCRSVGTGSSKFHRDSNAERRRQMARATRPWPRAANKTPPARSPTVLFPQSNAPSLRPIERVVDHAGPVF